jgi:hypothetical protein
MFDGYVSQTKDGYEVAHGGSVFARGLTLAEALSRARETRGRLWWLVTMDGQKTRLVFDD